MFTEKAVNVFLLKVYLLELLYFYKKSSSLYLKQKIIQFKWSNNNFCFYFRKESKSAKWNLAQTKTKHSVQWRL